MSDDKSPARRLNQAGSDEMRQEMDALAQMSQPIAASFARWVLDNFGDELGDDDRAFFEEHAAADASGPVKRANVDKVMSIFCDTVGRYL